MNASYYKGFEYGASGRSMSYCINRFGNVARSASFRRGFVDGSRSISIAKAA